MRNICKIMTILLALFSGCAPDVSPQKLQTSSCVQQTSSYDSSQSFSMTGGEATGDFPAVVFLARREGQGVRMCSAVFVGPNTLFTAAHCLNTAGDGGVQVFTGIKYDARYIFSNGIGTNVKVRSAFYATHPSVYINDTSHDAAKNAEYQAGDFAVLVTEGDSAPAIARLSNFNPEVGEEFQAMIVGYGKDEAGHVGTKRKGQATLEKVYTNLSTRSQAYRDTGASQAKVADGDSGGGVFVGGELIAISTNENNVSLPINSPRIQDTIAQAKRAGAIIGTASSLDPTISYQSTVDSNSPNGNCLSVR